MRASVVAGAARAERAQQRPSRRRLRGHTCHLSPHRDARQRRSQRSLRRASAATARPPPPEAAHIPPPPHRDARQHRSRRSPLRASTVALHLPSESFGFEQAQADSALQIKGQTPAENGFFSGLGLGLWILVCIPGQASRNEGREGGVGRPSHHLARTGLRSTAQRGGMASVGQRSRQRGRLGKAHSFGIQSL
jgi:hypothetical protein